MCKLKQWHPKSPWRNIHSQEPRAPKSCSIRAPIRAPKSCSIRAPDSGPEKSYTIRAPKRWLVDTNVQNGGLQRAPRNIHSQEPGPRKVVRFGPRFGPRKAVPFGSRIRAPKNCLIRAPIRAPKSCPFRVPDSGPEKLFDSGPDSGPEKLFHSGPGFGPRKAVPFGPRVQAGFRRGGREVAGSNPACPILLRRVTPSSFAQSDSGGFNMATQWLLKLTRAPSSDSQLSPTKACLPDHVAAKKQAAIAACKNHRLGKQQGIQLRGRSCLNT